MSAAKERALCEGLASAFSQYNGTLAHLLHGRSFEHSDHVVQGLRDLLIAKREDARQPLIAALVKMRAERDALRDKLAAVEIENEQLREDALPCFGDEHRAFCRHWNGLKRRLDAIENACAAPDGKASEYDDLAKEVARHPYVLVSTLREVLK